MIVKLTESKLRTLIKKALMEADGEEALVAAEKSQKALSAASSEDKSVMGQTVDVSDELESLTAQVNAMAQFYKSNPGQYTDLVKNDIYSLRQSISNLESALKAGSTQITRGEMTKSPTGLSIWDKADRYRKFTEL